MCVCVCVCVCVFIQVSFAPARAGRYTARLSLESSALNQSSRSHTACLAEVQLTAAGEIAAIQVIFTCVPLFDIFMHLISVFSTQNFLLCNLLVDEI